ncbi:hypothetical protein [Lysinibacillus sphaericus]|uniref:hypothetical protein n=1 Tax=Lysinibacillus sphaericus TaxID=1421 RepID=UPI00039B8467|nr:hypothetical protein [Lysinibacillus sphaericus]
MQLSFIKDEKVDLISLRAYESLVGSSIINTLQINPENILVIKDVKSTFKQDVKLIQATKEKGKDKLTLNNKENYDITNDIFDGESLLDNSVFAEHGVADKGFALLRQHFFKSAAFNTNIQDFLKDNTPDEIEYDDWEITNMFGEPMFAKNVDMICTPNSLKFMKFAYKMNKNTDFENQKAMWGFWKAIVGNENNVFGVCKHESASHAGVDENGFMVQRMSYQMLNASGASYGDIKQLSQFELNYIEKLKNDVMTFIQHLEMTKSEQNVNQLYIDLYNRNQNIVYTKFFKDFRSSIVNRYINKLKRGNIRVRADNLVLCSNPIEMLYAAIGKLTKIEPITLSCNQVYTTQFEFSEEIVLHRNPTTSPSNMLLAKNTYNEKIKKYINVTKNILVVNSIKHDIMTRLSGCDYDSDFVHTSNDKTLFKLATYAKENYTLCVDDVEEDSKTTYSLNDDDMALADDNIGVSGKLIGEIVNLGQLCMSVHYHLVNNNKYDDAKDVMHLVDLVTCISTLVIDMAKKSFVVNIKGEIASIRGKIKKYVRTNNKTTTWICKEKDHTVKPLFFEMVESKKDKVVYEQYKCPMDFLQSILKEESKRATETKTIELTDLLNTYDKDKANRNQLDELIKIGNELNTYFKKIHTKSLPKEKKTNAINDFMRKMKTKIIKLKMKEDTVYALLLNIFDEKSRVKLDTKHTRLLKLIAETHTDTFVNVFCENFNGSSIENSLKTA